MGSSGTIGRGTSTPTGPSDRQPRPASVRTSLARRASGVVVVGATLALGVAPSSSVWAADPPSVQLPIAALAPGGPAGVAIVTQTDDGTTSVQVFAKDAPEGTSVALHAGTCDEVSSDVIGLVGTIGQFGQVSASVPVPFATVADGGHVIAFHPGLDLATSLACGAIPGTAAAPVVPPLVDPGPATPPPVEPEPQPQPDAACAAVIDWVAAVKADLVTLGTLQDAANKAAASNNLQAYLNTVAANVGTVGTMISAIQARPFPPEAAAAQEELLSVMTLGRDAATMILDAFGSGDTSLYQQGVAKATEAADRFLKLRTTVAALEATCPAPAPTG